MPTDGRTVVGRQLTCYNDILISSSQINGGNWTTLRINHKVLAKLGDSFLELSNYNDDL